jgi:hypothetical protein
MHCPAIYGIHMSSIMANTSDAPSHDPDPKPACICDDLSIHKFGILFLLMIAINACAIDSHPALLSQNNKAPQEQELLYAY